MRELKWHEFGLCKKKSVKALGPYALKQLDKNLNSEHDMHLIS